MDLLNSIIEEVIENGTSNAKLNFNREFLNEMIESGNSTISYSDLLKLNVIFRSKKSNKDLTEESYVRETVKKSKKYLRGFISNAKDNGGFNWWAENTANIEDRIEWNDTKTLITFIKG